MKKDVQSALETLRAITNGHRVPLIEAQGAFQTLEKHVRGNSTIPKEVVDFADAISAHIIEGNRRIMEEIRKNSTVGQFEEWFKLACGKPDLPPIPSKIGEEVDPYKSPEIRQDLLLDKLFDRLEKAGLLPSTITAPADKDVLNDLCDEAHAMACSKGWWDDPRGVPECLALIHSEVSEALEDYRNGMMGLTVMLSGQETVTPPPETLVDAASAGGKPVGFNSELADILIRVFDLAGYMNIDLAEAVRAKMAYNATRPHRHGGKLA